MKPIKTLALPLLAVDCTLGTSLSLHRGLHTATGSWQRHSGQLQSSAILHVLLAEMVAEAGIGLADVATVACTVGPAGFTGSRLGLAVAQALQLAQPNVVIVALSTLHAAAQQTVAVHAPEGPFRVALDAAGGQAYVQGFAADGTPMDAAQCLPQADIPTLQPALPLAAPATMMLATTLPLGPLNAAHLLPLAANPARHQPLAPVYLKDLGYHVVGA
jgi:tRNA threonylcarbamoyl adenosine modification protein YeaZ